MAKVDTQDGNVAVGNKMDGTEEGAVATNGEQKIEVALGECVGDNVRLDTLLVEELDEKFKLWAIFFFDVTDVEGYDHGLMT